MSTSPFLQARLEKRREIPLMAVMAYMIFCLPSTLVFSTRRMCWKASPAMRDCKTPTQGFSHRSAKREKRRERCCAYPHLDVAVYVVRPPRQKGELVLGALLIREELEHRSPWSRRP